MGSTAISRLHGDRDIVTRLGDWGSARLDESPKILYWPTQLVGKLCLYTTISLSSRHVTYARLTPGGSCKQTRLRGYVLSFMENQDESDRMPRAAWDTLLLKGEM